MVTNKPIPPSGGSLLGATTVVWEDAFKGPNVMWRVPRHESVVSPGSHCPSCNTPLRAFELVPVFSWIALRGRCRTCACRISIRYPIVEAACALLFAFVAWLLVD